MIAECTIVRQLATGGQKTVFLATHHSLGDVVIKTSPITSFIGLERIKREVDLLKSLDSEFYPKQHHFNIDVTANKFEIIEQYIEGDTLRNMAANFKDSQSIFKLLKVLIEGLTIIWSKNIVHRDLKPENIIIRPNGQPCIIDLGIARFLDMDSLTRTLAAMGPCTPIYASPEQLTNNKGIIDPRSDFFSLGIISLELFLGVHPFDPTHVKNHYSILENIIQNFYIAENDHVKADANMTEFASKVLRTQPFERIRNYQLFDKFITERI